MKEYNTGPILRNTKPYYSCRTCRYFRKDRVATGGMKGAPLYTTTCNVKEMPKMIRFRQESSIDKTPYWCPFLENKVERNK